MELQRERLAPEILVLALVQAHSTLPRSLFPVSLLCSFASGFDVSLASFVPSSLVYVVVLPQEASIAPESDKI